MNEYDTDAAKGKILQAIKNLEEKIGSLTTDLTLAFEAYKAAAYQNDHSQLKDLYEALFQCEKEIETISKKYGIAYNPSQCPEKFLNSLSCLETEINYVGAILQHQLSYVHYFRYVAFRLTDNARRPFKPI